VKIGKGSKGFWRYSSEFNWRSPGLDLNDIGFMQMADLLEQETEVSYFVTKPVSIFRSYSVAVHQSNNWDYGANYLYSGLFLTSKLEFLNRWMVSPSLHYRNEGYDNRILRGGPAMLLPALWEGSLDFHTDMARKFILSLNASTEAARNDSYTNSNLQATVTVIPYNALRLSASLNYSENMDNLQYVDTKVLNTGTKYILAHLNQKTLGATFRIDYNISPEISIQYYGSPFASVGKYSRLKEVTNPRADAYADRFKLLNTQFSGNTYHVPASNDTPAYSVDNPDFTFNQFRSNLVFRWEYRPGSQLYFVWGNERTGWKNDSSSSVGKAITQLKDVSPNNIFLIKLSYWFSL
jgi:hypothetical protein